MKIFDIIQRDIKNLIDEHDLGNKSRKREYVAGRTVFYLKLRPYASLERIGSLFGDRDHATVLSAIKRYNEEDRHKWAEMKLAHSYFDTLIDEVLYRYNFKQIEEIAEHNKTVDSMITKGIIKRVADPNINEISSLRILEQQIAKKLQDENRTN